MTTRKTAYPDATTVIAIATEMAASVKTAIDALPAFADRTKNRKLSEDIQRISDTARLISLRVVAMLCDEAHELAVRIESGMVQSGATEIDALRNTLIALHRYISTAANGKINSGFALYPAYTELMRCLPSRAAAVRQELFLPVQPVYGPNSPTYNEGKFIAEVARYLDEFRQATKRYADKKDFETINAMRTTLVTMENKNPPANFRLLLSLAISFMDVGMRAGGKIARDNEPLMQRIDRELSGVVKGELEIEEGTISWLMFVIGQASQFSARIRAFQEMYELQRLVDEEQAGSITDQTLSAARNALENAQRSWESAMLTNGDKAGAKGACFALIAISNTLGDYAMKTMAVAMGSLADGIADDRIKSDAEIAVFGASVLVALGERLERIVADPKGGRAVADFQRDRVRSVLAGKRPGDLPMEMPSQGAHVQAILDELVNDITSAEQIVEQCLRDGAKESKIDEVNKLFNVVHSALSFVNMNEAAAYSLDVARQVEKVLRVLASGTELTVDDKTLLADSVMLLHRYISVVNVDRAQATQVLERGTALFANQNQDVSEVQEIAADDGPFDICSDEVLGPIFFEEAKGVIQDLIHPGVEKLRANIRDEDTMLDVRRGFHTLKGSSRMVELTNLGMLGQHVEYVLNIYRDNHNLKPTSELLDWLEEAANVIGAAVDILESGKPAKVDPAPYERVYENFKEAGVFSRLLDGAPVKAAVAVEKAQPHEGFAPKEVPDLELAVHIPETGVVIMPVHEDVALELVKLEDKPLDVLPLDAENPPVLDASDNAVESEALPEIDLALIDPQLSHATKTPSPPQLPVQLPPQLPVIGFADDIASPEEAGATATSEPSLPDLFSAPGPDIVSEISLVADTPSSAQKTQESEPEAGMPEPILETVDIVPTTTLVEAPMTVTETITETPLDSSGEVLIGNVSIPTPLYNSFVSEARNFYTNIEEALFAVIRGPRKTVDYETMRMAHSLAGMGRTTGLKAVTQLAGALETWVALNQDRELRLTDDAKKTLSDVLETLDAMLAGIEAYIEPVNEDGIIARLQVIIDADERRMAHEGADVTESMINRMQETNAAVSDDGVHAGGASPGGDSIAPPRESLPEAPVATPADSPIALTIETQVADAETEVARVANPFRLGADTPCAADAIGNTQSESGTGASTATEDPVATEAYCRTASRPGTEADTQASATRRATLRPATGSKTGAETGASPLAPNRTEANGISKGQDACFSSQASAGAQASAQEPADSNHGLVGPSDRQEVTSQPDQDKGDSRALMAASPQDSASGRPQPVHALTPQAEQQPHAPAANETAATPLALRFESSERKGLPPNTSPVSNNHTTRLPPSMAVDWLKIASSKEDDIDTETPEMFDIFCEEADERFEEIDTTIGQLQDNIGDKALTNILKRAVHTLKGSANTAGCRKIGAIFHYLEDLMDAVGVLNESTMAILQSGVDAAHAGLQGMRKGKSVESSIQKMGQRSSVADFPREEPTTEIVESTAQQPLDSVGESIPVMPAENATVETLASDAPGGELALPNSTTVRAVSPAPTVAQQHTASGTGKSEEEDDSLRVSTRLLDKMVKAVGEVNISRSRVKMNVDVTKASLAGLALSLENMYTHLRQIELEAEKQMSSGDQNAKIDSTFDALQMDRFTRLQELTRRVAEAQNDVMTQQGAALGAVRDMEEALANQNVLVSGLSMDLDQIRQIRVSSIVPKLRRVVRTACRDTGKKGNIFFDADVELDRGILTKVEGALEHILRNAIAHGIEAPEVRLSANKSESGTIEFRAYQDGGEVVIEIRDDGRGLDVKKIHASAVAKGVIHPGAHLSDDEIRNLIFEPGFSTAEQVTDIAGRGVGLDVVRSDIAAMGGRVELSSTLGAGTTFTLRVPATLTVIAGAAVLTNNHMYVIPASFIDRLVRINARELDEAYQTRKLLYKEEGAAAIEYEFWGMWQIAGASAWENRPARSNSILLMRNDRVAVHIDDIRPAGEFVFRPLGPQIAANGGLIGWTISSTGNASLVLDPSRVVRTLRLSIAAGKNDISALASAHQKPSPLVMIVDDSTTVRKVTARLLKKEGFRYVEAEDGMKAIKLLQSEMPDVILMDIEMPKMNGYEATQTIRATPETASVPIIMITSRAGDSHRQKAFELGVNAYLGKPYNESDLMDLIRKYTMLNAAANG